MVAVRHGGLRNGFRHTRLRCANCDAQHCQQKRQQALPQQGKLANIKSEFWRMTYTEQAAMFDWHRWELYRELQRHGESVPRIASRFGRTPCETTAHLNE